MTKIKISLIAATLTATATAILFTCEKVPDYCGSGAIYDPNGEFCFGSKPYRLCKDGDYNPLIKGCDPLFDRIGTRCSDSSVVPSGTPCVGYTLTTASTPAAAGNVEHYPVKSNYSAYDTISLNAIPAGKDYQFVGWAVALTDTRQMTTYVMNSNKSQVTIVAMFKPTANGRLTTAAFPERCGRVDRSPDLGDEPYSDNAKVRLTATPAPGYAFAGWSGAASGTVNPIQITMDESKTAVAMFEPVTRTLQVKVEPKDGGAVFINGSALAGGASQEVSAEIALWAREAENYVFDSWAGTSAAFENAGSQGTKAALLDTGAVITARFRPGRRDEKAVAPPLICALKTEARPPAGGSVSRSPDLENYPSGRTATVTASANEGYRFIGWSGSITSADSAVTVTMDNNMTLYADFQQDAPPEHVHDWGEWIVTNGPTCYSTGMQTRTCRNDPKYTENQTIAKLTGSVCDSGSGSYTVTVNSIGVTAATYGGGNYKAGDTVRIRVNATTIETSYNKCYTWSRWTTTSPKVSFDDAIDTMTTFIMPANNVTVTARFEKTLQTLTVNAYPKEGGTVARARIDTVSGTYVNIKAAANTGYTFSRWQMDDNVSICFGRDTIVDSTKEITYIKLHESTNVTAYFTKNPVVGDTTTPKYTVAVNNQYVNGSGSYKAGDTVSMQLIGSRPQPQECYTLYWTGSPYVTFFEEAGYENSFIMPANAVYVTVTTGKARPSSGSLYVRAEPPNGGEVDPTEEIGVAPGTRVIIKAAAKPGYTFSGWETNYNTTSVCTIDTSLIGQPDRDSTYIIVNDYVNVVAKFTSNRKDSVIVDVRDNMQYNTVVIGGKRWMAKNLNYQTAADSWCPNDSNDFCTIYGRLYTWNAAKTACPKGWHLPSRSEWEDLETAATADGYSAGYNLKSKSGWYNNGNGSDKFGFSALPGGSRDSNGNFSDAGYYGNWWTATEYSGGNAYYRSMGYDDDYVGEGTHDRSVGFSVRCVQDK